MSQQYRRQQDRPLTAAAKAFLIFSGLVIGSIVTAIVLLIGTAMRAEEARTKTAENTDLIRDVHKLLEVVLAVTSCTEEDTPAQCRERITNSSQVEGQRRILEVDCRLRRALAGLPAPQPDQPCIYP